MMDPSAAEGPREQPADAFAQDIFIGRQPILDREEQLVAYELLFRSGRHDHARIEDDMAATAAVISHTFNDFGVEEALGPCKGFINVSAEMLLSDAIELLPCDKIVLELLETIRLTPAVVQRCRDLQQDGFALALDDVGTLSPEQRSVLEFVDIVKVDVKTLSTAALAATTAELRQYPARLLAEKVDTREQARHCMDLGYSLFQGYYFARPTVISGRKLSHSEMSLLRLLGLLLNDADTRALEGMFKQEPGLSVNLLRLANSAGIAAHGNIASLRTAITLLGRRQLTRWLQILLFSNAAVKRPLRSPLLQLAATRGRFLELLAAQLAPGDQQLEDEAFMTGIMSLMPALLGVTMESIVAQLNVGGEVAQALERRAGRLGILLRLAESLEQEELDACGELLDLLPGLTPHQVTAAETQALAWANAIGQTDAA